MPVKPVALHEFIEGVGNIYEAIIAAAKRARQIHDETKIELNQRLETIKALTATTDAEEDTETVTANPDQLKISLEFEKRPKPTDIALEELKAKKFKVVYKEPEVNPFKKEESAE